MMILSPHCYIPSHKVIGLLVLEKKISEGFLPYMGMGAILVIWPRPRKQTFVPPSHWGSIWNLALIRPAVLEKKIFENGGTKDRRRRTDNGTWLYYKLTNEPKGTGELKMQLSALSARMHKKVFEFTITRTVFQCLHLTPFRLLQLYGATHVRKNLIILSNFKRQLHAWFLTRT